MLAHVDNRITYSGNGNATEFAYQFKILDRTDIKVLLTDADGKEKLLTKDYYVDVEKNVVRYPGYAVGAEVPESERPPVLPAGWKLTIYREVPVTQETDLPDQYPFNQVEDIGDKLTMIAQQLTDVTSRSLKISVNKSADIDTTIPFDAGKSFRIADDGKSIVVTEDPARVLPLAQGVYAQAQAQAQSAYASAVAAAQSEDSAAASASEAGNSAQSASTSAASAVESARLAEGYKQETLTAKADAATSATNAKASEANAKQASVSASASETEAKAAKVAANEAAANASNSASEAKRYESEANSYAENAKEYAATATTKASETTAKVIEATDEANRAKAEADRAKSISDNIGNPVSDVTENNGTVTVTKSNGTQSTFMAFPQDANGTLPIAKGGTGANNAKQARANLEVEPIGTIYAFAGNNIPNGYLPCNGSAISRTTYADLFAVIGTTYGSGDGSTTFNLPNLTDKFIQGSNTAGTNKEAGVPNVWGEFALRGAETLLHNNGAFYHGGQYKDPYNEHGERNSSAIVSFDANRCNTVYGNSTTVQPPALTMRYIIKY